MGGLFYRILVQKIFEGVQFRSTLFIFEMDQMCNFEQFESGPKLQFDTWSEIQKRNKVFFFPKLHICSRSRVRVQFWSTFKLFDIAILVRFEQKIVWTKIEFSNQIQHVILNSFKYFSGKFGPPRVFTPLVISDQNFDPKFSGSKFGPPLSDFDWNWSNSMGRIVTRYKMICI